MIECDLLHIELIATDGKVQKRILWVAVTSNGVYSGHCFEDRDMHISYHFDGNVYHNWFGEKPTKTLVLPPLKDFKGYRQLYSSAFTSNLSHLHNTPPYRLKKLDAIVNIDVRSYREGIGCNVYMLEPKRSDKIEKIIRGHLKIPITEAHVFLASNPWILITLYGQIYRESK